MTTVSRNNWKKAAVFGIIAVVILVSHANAADYSESITISGYLNGLVNGSNIRGGSGADDTQNTTLTNIQNAMNAMNTSSASNATYANNTQNTLGMNDSSDRAFVNTSTVLKVNMTTCTGTDVTQWNGTTGTCVAQTGSGGTSIQPQDFLINVSGTTYYSMYGANGTVYTSNTVLGHVINKTITASTPGSKIEFASGSFCFAGNQSHAEINQSNITISGQGVSTVIRLCDPTRNTAFFIIERVSNVTLRNMKMISAGSDQYNGAASGPQVRNEPQSPVYLRESSNNIVEDLEIYDSPHYSIADANGTNNTIRRVKGYNSYYSDIILMDTNFDTVQDSVSVGAREGHGLYLEWAYSSRLINNVLLANKLDGARLNNSRDSVIRDSTTRGNRFGISVDNSSNATVRDNDISGAKTTGIVLGFMNTPKTEHAYLTGNKLRSQGVTPFGLNITVYANNNSIGENDFYASGTVDDILDQGYGNKFGNYVDNSGNIQLTTSCLGVNTTCTLLPTALLLQLRGDDTTGAWFWLYNGLTGNTGNDGGWVGHDGSTMYVNNKENGDVRFGTNNVFNWWLHSNGGTNQTSSLTINDAGEGITIKAPGGNFFCKTIDDSGNWVTNPGTCKT